ncbi:class I SAM-dependent methyltransferase [Rufibacter tibetensis]|uniref:Methyltransferase domain-containing protein n=1 Tax=Rufibacter tibetensis TaxID=512763 RepID=A0A0P0CQK0_9BACT|nr:class I SAM-dependent methyltransferase [Rufibacter tibetensis]ALI99650.1 hypothetical protein DC20_12550 [Rufibacter tibetensis]
MPSSSVPDFNLISPVYDALAKLVYGKSQQRAQAHFLSCIPAGARVLILGGGSGWILNQVLQHSTPAHVLFLEASSKMLEKAKGNVLPTASKTTVEFRLGTEASLSSSEMFHVVLTPFVLDLFTPQQAYAMMQRLDQALFPTGLWLHTDFYLSPSPLRKIWQKPLLWGMYWFFGLVSGILGKTLPPFESLFQKLGYKPQQEAFFYGKFIRAQVLQKAALLAKTSK